MSKMQTVFLSADVCIYVTCTVCIMLQENVIAVAFSVHNEELICNGCEPLLLYTIGMLCVWLSGLLLLFRSISAGKHFQLDVQIIIYLWIETTEPTVETSREWGTNNMATFPEFNWVQNCIDNLNLNESIPIQWKNRKILDFFYVMC